MSQHLEKAMRKLTKYDPAAKSKQEAKVHRIEEVKTIDGRLVRVPVLTIHNTGPRDLYQRFKHGERLILGLNLGQSIQGEKIIKKFSISRKDTVVCPLKKENIGFIQFVIVCECQQSRQCMKLLGKLADLEIMEKKVV